MPLRGDCVLSLWGLWLIGSSDTAAALALAWGLLPLQILYKLATWPSLGWRSPVVRTNIGVAAFHVLALVTIS